VLLLTLAHSNGFWAVILELQIPNLWLRIITNLLLICETVFVSKFLLCGARVSDLRKYAEIENKSIFTASIAIMAIKICVLNQKGKQFETGFLFSCYHNETEKIYKI